MMEGLPRSAAIVRGVTAGHLERYPCTVYPAEHQAGGPEVQSVGRGVLTIQYSVSTSGQASMWVNSRSTIYEILPLSLCIPTESLVSALQAMAGSRRPSQPTDHPLIVPNSLASIWFAR